jgi:hypothetical protein
MTTTLYNLLNRNAWDDVKVELLRLYPDEARNLKAYTRVHKQLLEMSPTPNDDDVSVRIEYVEDDEFGDYWDVAGVKPGSDELWAIEYARWERWLGFYVDDDTLQRLSEPQIIAYCLYEMTWAGFDQDKIQRKMHEIADILDEIDNNDSNKI